LEWKISQQKKNKIFHKKMSKKFLLEIKTISFTIKKFIGKIIIRINLKIKMRNLMKKGLILIYLRMKTMKTYSG
jgi:hypothetical protein